MLNQPLTRAGYRAMLHRMRSDIREGLKRNSYFRSCSHVEINGAPYSVFISRERSGRTVESRFNTSLLSERPRRQLAADALAWAARYRRDAARRWHSDGMRARDIAAARACIAEAAAYRTAFNRLPGS